VIEKKKVDTVWSYQYEEEVHAIESLIKDLNITPPLSILQPDKGYMRPQENRTRPGPS